MSPPAIARRFRGFLPVVVDVETGGFDQVKDALLEIAAVTIRMDEEGYLHPSDTHSVHVLPFPGAQLNPKALEFNGIDPHHPFRQAVTEDQALNQIFTPIRHLMKVTGCKRAILVGHNAFFDLGFINAAVARTGCKHNPFHHFSTLDTVSFAALALGQTVLARALKMAGLEWDAGEAHSAVYDAQQTATLFCAIVNRWQELDPVHIWSRPEAS